MAFDVAQVLGYSDAFNMTHMLNEWEADTHIVSIRSENNKMRKRYLI